MDDEWDDFDEDGDDEVIVCPECGGDVYADVESCPECGYWITDADRTAAWHAGSATGRIKTIGLAALGLAVVVWLLAWLT